jgi:hypothetical protein
LAAQDRPDLQRELTDAFDAFRAALRQVLEDEAQRSVTATIERLGSGDGPFRVVDADVQVVIRRLELSADAAESDRSAATPRARRAPAPSGRGRSAVREALIATFATADAEMTADDVQAALARRGVETSTDNLYQQLRRLVQAGELVRPGRGRYRRAGTAAAA